MVRGENKLDKFDKMVHNKQKHENCLTTLQDGSQANKNLFLAT